jgi:hypothetical protein
MGDGGWGMGDGGWGMGDGGTSSASRLAAVLGGTITRIGALSAIVGNYGVRAMIDNRTQVFDVAMKNARTIEACVDRLTMMGADHELKLIARRLSRLTFRAAPSEEAMRVPA